MSLPISDTGRATGNRDMLDMATAHLSLACSIDGFLNDSSLERLILSSPEDMADVHRQRALHDAILVGAATVRADNPSLGLRDSKLRVERLARGQDPDPIKVTVTRAGNIDPQAHFFRAGDGRKIVICPSHVATDPERRLFDRATVIGLTGPITSSAILVALGTVGIGSVFVEGGNCVLSMFLSEGTFVSLRLAIAPFFVGDPRASRFGPSCRIGFDRTNRLSVTGVRLFGDMTVVEFAPSNCTNT